MSATGTTLGGASKASTQTDSIYPASQC